MIIGNVIKSIHDNAQVRDVRICVHATIVESIRLGLCGHTRPDQAYELIKRQDVVANHGRLRDFPAKDLAQYALSRLPIEASVGVAAVNSLLDVDWTKVKPQRTADAVIEHARGRNTVIVGHFPFNERVRKVANRLDVLGLEPGAGDRPVSEAHETLPRADIAFISANTIVNHTLDHLLKLCQNTQFVAIVGNSVIFSPVFFRYGVHALFGALIEDVETVIRHICEGASLHHLPGMTEVAMYSKDFLGV